MSTLYIKNISELSLPRCAQREGRGYKDLTPGQSGVLGLPADAPIIKAWLEKERIKFLTEEEYQAEQNPTPIETPVAAAKVITLEDGSAAINPGYDSIPETDTIPEPIVSNIDKTGKVIAVQAPPDTVIVEPAKGDPIVLKSSEFAPKILKDNGTVVDTAPVPKTVLAQELAGTVAPQAIKPVETLVAESTETEATPETTTAVTTEQATPVAPEVRAAEIASLKSWRQQDKALRTSTIEVIALVKTQTKFDVVSKLCDEMIAKKSS